MSKAPDLAKLGTERSNPSAAALDTRSALGIARLINDEDTRVPFVIRTLLPDIARAIDAIAKALFRGGRLIYVGAGTSGRMAALDASECPPTFNTPPRMVQYVIAGGARALARAAEVNEDSPKLGRRDLAKKRPTKRDVVVGVSASGRTPYTLGALEYARERGAATVAVVGNPGSAMEQVADIAIVAETGPEVVAGSTRMKAGTAQKLVLNMLTTGAMTRLGYVYGNLMVNVHLKNRKLVERGLAILKRAAGLDREAAKQALKAAGNSVPVALVMLKAGVSRAQARRRLAAVHGHVRRAMEG